MRASGSHVRKDGTEAVYERHLLRRSFRNAQGKPDKETPANLTPLPAEAIAAIRSVLAGKTLVDVAEAFEITRSRPHGHMAAVHAMARQLGLPALLGPAGRETRPGPGVDHLAGGAAEAETVHIGMVGRCDPRRGPGRGRCVPG